MTESQIDLVQQSEHAVYIQVGYPIDEVFKGVLTFNINLYKYAQKTGAVIWDSETRELFSPEAWKEKRLAAWLEDGIPSISEQTVIHAYEGDIGIRAISLGMHKFDLPDIVVDNFEWSTNSAMAHLINLTGQSIMEGTKISDDDKILLDIEALSNTKLKRTISHFTSDDAIKRLDIEFAEGKWEEGDPENYLIELKFNDHAGSSLSEKQALALKTLFGYDGEAMMVKHNQKIEEASENAKKKLPLISASFNKGLAPGESIHVKAPFSTDSGSTEWMWVEVTQWKGTKIEGVLRNEPMDIDTLKLGAMVAIDQNDVFDYIHYRADGTVEGNETQVLLNQARQ
ncbi:DUF2314 domain-containing protein [Enterovibrio sp. ZSDZ35]|uniref:DUF2314 domain-containing protein n=1 Tax=Enterovibrio qingdaonensis TaxID=2899818 RepID=A0ABT5QII9_9GAMM|nr:DUF2314 domain-containing protein [Enterovibrio sp. ZSDZ35]MDD1780285.1 DUF2314 domain-containing protein [Enterovibrio sp. ZSDZ35]